MYSLTKAAALEFTEKNNFSSKGDINQKVEMELILELSTYQEVCKSYCWRSYQEGLDYTVNYEIGKVKILDEGLKASNIPIDISVENNSFLINKTNGYQE